jgi:Putative beta-barrel porin-2, OmpL-like. bbp2
MFALGFALAFAPLSRAENQPSDQPASETTAANQPAASSAQPAATPTSDQRLEELEKQVMALQEEIASMKAANAAAAAAEPANPAAANVSPGPAPVDAPAKISISSLLGPITLSGFGDAYYSFDPNHPQDNLEELRSFEAPTNGFNFNMAELILDKAADTTSAENRLGYHVSAGYGTAAKIINGSDNPLFTDDANFFLKEAYVDYIAPVGKGLTITVGKFVTPMGAEVIESNANWNYSRGLLFDYAIPFFHFGASAKYAFNSKFALTGYLVNGWNNTIISHAAIQEGQFGPSSGLTYGVSLAFTPNAKWSITTNYFAGPVTGAIGTVGQTLNDWKQISDTTIGFTPNAKWAFQINGDYGFGPRYYFGDCFDDDVASARPVRQGGEPGTCSSTPSVNWGGIAGYVKYTFNPKSNLAVRYEWMDDPDGYEGMLENFYTGEFFNGWAQEVTATYSYNLTSALLIRGEYRYDFASQPIFQQSLSSTVPGQAVKEQNTALISFVYSFSSANLK